MTEINKGIPLFQVSNSYLNNKINQKVQKKDELPKNKNGSDTNLESVLESPLDNDKQNTLIKTIQLNDSNTRRKYAMYSTEIKQMCIDMVNKKIY